MASAVTVGTAAVAADGLRAPGRQTGRPGPVRSGRPIARLAREGYCGACPTPRGGEVGRSIEYPRVGLLSSRQVRPAQERTSKAKPSQT